MGDVSTMVMGPTRGTFVKPDSVLARTAREMVQAHGGGAGPQDGMSICPQCGDPLPCAAGRAAAEVLAAAGLAESSGLVQAARQGRGPAAEPGSGPVFPAPRHDDPLAGGPGPARPDPGQPDIHHRGPDHLGPEQPDQAWRPDQPSRDDAPAHPQLDHLGLPTGPAPAVRPSDQAPPTGRPPLQPPQSGQSNRPTLEPPQLGQSNRPTLEPPQSGQSNRPTLEPPQSGQQNRPTLEPPQLGQQNRPTLEPPQLGQQNRPLLEPPSMGQQNRPSLQPPQAGVQPPQAGGQPPQAGGQPPVAGRASVPSWSTNAVRHIEDTAPSGLPGLDNPSPNGAGRSEDADRRGGGHPNDPSAA